MTSEVERQKSLKQALVGFVFGCFGMLLGLPAAWAQQSCPAAALDIQITGYCELCGGGEVTLTLTNNTAGQPGNTNRIQYRDENRDFTNVQVTVDLGGLETVYDASQYTFNIASIPRGTSVSRSFTLTAENGVREQLVNVFSRQEITASATYSYDNCGGEEYRQCQNNGGGGCGSFSGNWGDWQNLPGQGSPSSESDTGTSNLDIREPGPVVTKAVRNIDAGMPDFSDQTVPNGDITYGHEGDGIIWRVNIANGGNAPMYDVIFDDSMSPGGAANMDIRALCLDEGNAEVVANGGAIPPSCTAISGDEIVGRPLSDFNSGWNVLEDGEQAVMFLAGTLRNSCVGQVNTVSNVLWGCFNNNGTPENGHGGIADAVLNGLPSYQNGDGSEASFSALAAATLSEGLGNEGSLNYQVEYSGLVQGDPVGMRGMVRIRVQNLTGGTVKNVVLTDTLPEGYILDPNFEPQLTITSFDGNYNDYAGRVSSIDWVNRVPVTGDQSYLGNTDLKTPIFHLTSDGENANPGYVDSDDGVADADDQVDLLRHGDEATVTFRIVQVNQDGSLTYYDRMANLDDQDESGERDGSRIDPPAMTGLSNRLHIAWEDFCSNNGLTHAEDAPLTTPFAPDPENLNVDIPHPLYIIRDEGTTPITVNIWNSGGHTASDYLFYVTFGQAIIVEGVPTQCDFADGNPPSLPGTFNVPGAAGAQIPLWNTPAWRGDSDPNGDGNPLPTNAIVYRCDLGAISGGGSGSLEFEVRKNHDQSAADDLSMRADVVGMITLADDSRTYTAASPGALSIPADWRNSDEALVYPTPANLVGGTTPSQQLANNYTLDTVRARALGFNLLKRYVPGSCKEADYRGSGDGDGRANPPQILIGEECDYEIYAGGWFGFDTPGWNITVEPLSVGDALPAHAGGDDSATGTQHFVQQQELPALCSTSGGLPGSPNSVCRGVVSANNFTPDAVLGGGDLSWLFGGVEVITKDRWFLANMTTRLRNEGEDSVSAPNLHSDISVDYGRSSFRVEFAENTGIPIFAETVANDGSGGAGACFKSGDSWDAADYSSSNPSPCNPDYPGYPQWQEWTAQSQVVEPRLEITKQVCNLSAATGDVASCSWADQAVGSKFDDFVYRLTVKNEAAAEGVSRAPAYDVVITDVLDDRGQMCVWAVNGAFDTDDGIENIPGDSNPDAGQVGTAIGLSDYSYDYRDPEASPHCLDGGSPAHVTFSFQQSSKLKQIDPDAEVVLQYRVSPHRTVAPGQPFNDVADIFRYDSLVSDAGQQTVAPVANQNHPLGDGSELPAAPDTPRSGGARIYCSNADDESEYCKSANTIITIYEVEVEPIEALGQSTLGEYAPRQGDVDAVVGEEIRLRLTGQVPASQLGDFTFHAELPEGLRCIAAEEKDLRTIPGSVWFPGDNSEPLVPTISGCESAGGDGSFVRWEYGDQHLLGPEGLITVQVTFVVRVENNNFTGHDENLVINGGGDSYMSYLPPGASSSERSVFVPPPITVHVNGPRIALEKSFDDSLVTVDGDDVITVTVKASNTGTPGIPTSATAYNLQILDDLRDTKYRYVPGSPLGINGTPTPQVRFVDGDTDAPVFYWDDPSPDAIAGTSWAAPYAIAEGEFVEFSFQLRVVGEANEAGDDVFVSPHETLANTIEAIWQSLPNQNLNLNIDPLSSGGAIGADGMDDGMRNGWFSTDSDPQPDINDYETVAEDSVSVGGLLFAKTDITENGDVPEARTIGAHRTFRLDISLPEGVTENVAVTDTLSTGYAIANPDHGYEIRCEYDDTILAINDETPDSACGQFAGVLPQHGDTGVLSWNIGKVTTHTEDDTGVSATNGINPVIRIYYVARIENIEGIVADSVLTNSAELNYLNAPETLSGETSLTVAESALTVSKTASAASAVSGDTVDYTIAITNGSGASTAYDVNIADLLPEQLRLESATIDGVDYMPATRADGSFVWGRENEDNSLDIAPGQTLTLVYTTTVLSAFGSDIENTVYVDWTSLNHGALPGQDTYPGDYERHGQGCPSISTDTPWNNYCTQSSAQVTTEDSTEFSKTAISDAWGAMDRARIGDTVQYTLNLGIQPGITRNAVVTDELPAGLALVSVDSYDCGVKGFACSQSPAELPAGTTGTLQWQFGDITAESDSTPPFTIVYTAVVLDDEAVFPAGSGEIERENIAQFNYDGAAEILQGQASIWVVQPNITDLVKSDTRSGVTSPYTVVDIASEVMNFRLQALNTGGAPAYGAVITDTLNIDAANPEFDDSTINIVQVQVAGESAEYEVVINGGIIEFTLSDVVPEGAAILIDYQVGLNTAIPSGHTWYNRFHIANYVSSDISVSSGIDGAAARAYEGSAPACESGTGTGCFTLMTPVADPEDLTLQLLEPGDGRAPIGQAVSYRITVPASPIAGSTLADVQVENTLLGRDTAIAVESVTIDGEPVTVADGEIFTIDVGDIPPNEVREIVVSGWVANHEDAQSGQTFDISATYTYSEAGVITEMGGESVTITVIEPELALTQSAINQSGNTEPVAGDLYRFSLALAEQGANGSTAYDLSVLEELGIGWAYQPGSALFNGVAIADPVINGDGIDTAQTLAWNAVANTDIPVGETRTLEFEVRVLDSVLAGQELTAATSAQWTSQAGAPVQVERDGSGMPDPAALNNYFLGPQSLPVLAIGNNATLAKDVIAETAPLNDGELRIGDLVTYELRLGVQRGTLPNAVVSDTLPEGMVFVDTVSIAAEGMEYDFTQEPVADSVGEVTWNLGTLLNTSGDEVVITYRARVQRDVLPLNAVNIELRNQASFQFDTAAGPSEPLLAEQAMNLLQPDLAFALTAVPDGSAALSPDEEIVFTATISNNGTAPAYDIVLRDVIPVGMRQGGVETVSVNGNTSDPLQPLFDAATGDVVWNFSNEIPAGETLEVVYRVTVDSDIAAGLQIGNNAYIEWYYSFGESEIPEGAVLDNRQPYGPSDAVSVLFSTPDAQPLLIAVEPVTREQASIGEPFVYRLTIPAVGALHDVAIQMDLADSSVDMVDLAFVSAEQVSGNIAFNPQGSVDGSLLTIEDANSGIDVEAGDEAVIDVTLHLRDTTLNQFGKSFTARAGYSYSYANDDPSAGRGTGEVSAYSAPIEIVEPYELVLTKSGDAKIQSGVAGRFLLDVHNRGSGPAWDLTVRDFLPSSDQGGMCETPPANFAVNVLDAGGNVVATLSEGSDFTTGFDAEQCTLIFTTSGANAALPADHHLQFAYDAWLDENTVDGATLDNVAGAEQWYSWDSTGPDARIYERSYASDPADGTPGVEDHEDVFTVTAAVPSVVFEKVVANITSGDGPATLAAPGDVLQYTLTLRNLSDVDVENVAITDVLDRLNSPAYFVPGTLQLIAMPSDGDSSATSATGGTNGTGLVDVRNFTLGAAGSGSEEVQLVYQVQLIGVIDSGSAVLNQAQLQLPGQALIDSDDPNINGAADPQVAGDEDPTRVIIESAPVLNVEKISEDLTGEPDSLMPGDTLRYTIRVENIGNENMLEASLRDQVPANTTYVAGSTTLNGAALDDLNGTTPLTQTLVIQSPGAETGELLADPAASGAQAAIITFDVTINNVKDGTLISNQGFANGVGAGNGNIPLEEKPSDDPTTEVADDPTIDIVGNVPLLRVQKTVQLAVDNLTTGIVDPEDVLRYTITVTNLGGKDATEARFVDLVPEHTTYVAGSTTLNGIAIADNGVDSPLVTGIAISSDDLTPPLPAEGEGVLTTAQTATIVFDVVVNVDTERGTIISNQGSVYSLELPLTLTDADGNSSNGAQPTEVVVGDAQQLSITKEVAVVGGGAAESGKVLEYIVRVTNISAVPASLVSIYDDLLVAGEGVLTYVADSARLNGLADGVMVDGPLITADYSSVYGDLQPSETITLRFEAKLGDNLAMGYTVVNTAQVKWNDPPAYNEATVTIDIGGTPGIANLSGYLWHDVNFSETADSEEQLLTNWNVELYLNNALLETVQSDENGYFQFAGLVPNMDGANVVGASYELRYLAPNAVSTTASLGNTSSDYTNGPQQIRDIYIDSGSNPQTLNLPITPNGVIYDSVLRAPVNGARVRLLGASSGQPLPDSCFDDPKQQNQVTLTGGFYKFDVNFSSAACAVNADYLIEVDVPSEDYVSGPSQIIPPQTGVDTGSFDVAACLGSAADMIPGTPDHCEVQLSVLPPSIDMDARSSETDYYLRVNLDDSNQPGSSQLFNNHIALDPQLEGALALTKTAAMLNVTRSQLVPYTITFSNSLPVPMTDLQLVDYFPAGFKYVAGSANLDGVKVEPVVNGLQLQWPHLRAEPEQTHSMKLLLVVGSGVGEGEYVNRARMFNELSGQQTSGEATATVRVVPDPTFDCTDVIGKVFDDKNLNGYQDPGEGGVPGARVVTANGLKATADAHGRFHITCAAVPNPDRGSNFVLKLDDRSLPSGYRLTTENPRVQRATRGKMLEFNFGTSLHRVVRLDLAEAVFEPGTSELRPQWRSRTELLLERLQEAPSVLRLSYLAENEDPSLVDARLATIKARIAEDWAALNCCYPLNIETEIFWRRGAPPARGNVLDGLKRSVNRMIGSDDQGGAR
ncbi:hypothetical protein PVT68_16400 [Microbulbifer bruguierae]|uniref:DUF11 domain-containing protein n=1 Tax=Microbulbifer bruguierae TaxID=3029061 RepID=A0ABY8NF13_9GAMM|nr:hypothetical protein [Microbulbifer bruguierae]WGL16337.1 hypothetical protein PVT68_16400 [Microbulbifer bruguierae]